MPNHITNILKFKGDSEQVHAMLDKIKSDELGFGSIDFNKIIPMPESLNIEAGSRTDDALYVCMVALNPAVPDMGIPKLSREEYQKLEIVVSQSKGVQFMQPDAQRIGRVLKHTILSDAIATGQVVISNMAAEIGTDGAIGTGEQSGMLMTFTSIRNHRAFTS